MNKYIIYSILLTLLFSTFSVLTAKGSPADVKVNESKTNRLESRIDSLESKLADLDYYKRTFIEQREQVYKTYDLSLKQSENVYKGFQTILYLLTGLIAFVVSFGLMHYFKMLQSIKDVTKEFSKDLAEREIKLIEKSMLDKISTLKIDPQNMLIEIENILSKCSYYEMLLKLKSNDYAIEAVLNEIIENPRVGDNLLLSYLHTIKSSDDHIKLTALFARFRCGEREVLKKIKTYTRAKNSQTKSLAISFLEEINKRKWD